MTRRNKLQTVGYCAVGLVAASLLVAVVDTPSASAADVTASIGCSQVVELDEFARPTGSSAATLCMLKNGQSVRVVTVSSHRAFSGYLAVRPELETAWNSPVAVIGSDAALRAAGLAPSSGEEG